MRITVRLLAVLLSAAAVVVGALLVIEAVFGAFTRGSSYAVFPWPASITTAETLSWDGTVTRTSLLAIIIVGLVLVIVALKASRRDIVFHDPAQGVRVTTDPTSLARLMQHRISEYPGVREAAVSLYKRGLTVQATARSDQVEYLRKELPAAAQDTMDDLPLRERPAVSVTVAPAREPR